MPKEKCKYALRLAGLLSLSVLWAGVAAAQTVRGCAHPTSEINIDDLTKAGLTDGEHVVGQAQMARGKLEVRVNVKNKVVSDPIFFIDGKRLKKTSANKIPKDLRECLKEQKKASSEGRRQIAFAGPLQQLYSYSPKIDAVWRGKCKVYPSCNQNTCCALAICGSGRAVHCTGY